MLVGTFEPARVMVAIAQANSASATTNTTPPSQPAGTEAGMNGKGTSQWSAKRGDDGERPCERRPNDDLAVAAVSLMAGPPGVPVTATVSPPSLPGLTPQVGFTRLAACSNAELGGPFR